MTALLLSKLYNLKGGKSIFNMEIANCYMIKSIQYSDIRMKERDDGDPASTTDFFDGNQ